MGIGLTLVLGGGEGMLNEVRDFYDLGIAPHTVIAINDALTEYPWPVDYAATLHPNKLYRDEPRWLLTRHQAGYTGPHTVIGHPQAKEKLAMPDWVELVLAHERWHGSSGLYAVQAAMDRGASGIVLCGVPMDKRPHLGGERKSWWQNQCPNYARDWSGKAYNDLKHRVRSMSGWTRELLGPPTVEWLTSAREFGNNDTDAVTETA